MKNHPSLKRTYYCMQPVAEMAEIKIVIETFNWILAGLIIIN